MPKPPHNNEDCKQHYGMLDSGTTDHFMSVTAKVNNICPTKNILNVIIPDGTNMKSTHKCEIDWPLLPKQSKTAHMIPQLAQQ